MDVLARKFSDRDGNSLEELRGREAPSQQVRNRSQKTLIRVEPRQWLEQTVRVKEVFGLFVCFIHSEDESPQEACQPAQA